MSNQEIRACRCLTFKPPEVTVYNCQNPREPFFLQNLQSADGIVLAVRRDNKTSFIIHKAFIKAQIASLALDEHKRALMNFARHANQTGYLIGTRMFSHAVA